MDNERPHEDVGHSDWSEKIEKQAKETRKSLKESGLDTSRIKFTKPRSCWGAALHAVVLFVVAIMVGVMSAGEKKKAREVTAIEQQVAKLTGRVEALAAEQQRLAGETLDPFSLGPFGFGEPFIAALDVCDLERVACGSHVAHLAHAQESPHPTAQRRDAVGRGSGRPAGGPGAGG